jgi:hypothetical protein
MIYYVKWYDSASTNGWIATEDTDKVTGIALCGSVGFVVREDHKELILALNRSEDGDHCSYGDCIAIPRCAIHTIKELADETLHTL